MNVLQRILRIQLGEASAQTRLLRRLGVVLLAVILVGIGTARLLGWGGRSGEVMYTFSERGPFAATITERGSLRAAETYTYSAPRLRRGGTQQILELITEGTMVEPGEVLVRFDNAALLESIRRQQNSIEVAEADLRRAQAQQESQMATLQANLETARHSHEQARLNLVRMEFSADIEKLREELSFQKSILSLQRSEEAIETQQRQNTVANQRTQTRLRRLHEELADMEAELGQSTLVSEHRGLVSYEYSFGMGGAGRAKIKPGDSPFAGQALISIPDLSRMTIDVQISELEIGRLGLNQKAIVQVDAFPEQIYSGTVTRISPLARRLGNSQLRVFDVTVTLDETDPVLRPGLTAQVSVITRYLADAVVVPVESIFRREGEPFVFVLDHGVEEIPVVLGDSSDLFVVITEGLTEGRMVAMRNPHLRLEAIGSAGIEALRQQREVAAGGGGIEVMGIRIEMGGGGGMGGRGGGGPGGHR